MTPTATLRIAHRRFFILLIAGLLLALAAGLWMLERTAGATPVSHISAVAVSHKTKPHPKPKPKPCDDTKRGRDADRCKPKPKPRKCDDDRKRRNDDDCRPPSGKPRDD
jgi:hypothetical protein